jgi:predicted glycoside hydrolase/deacetylase ChbG (UPF0249 family)
MMRLNPVLRTLGFDAKDRVVVLHADDIGACEATVSGLDELMNFGLVSSCSLMIPCHSFPQAAAYCRAHPGIDAGVHLTLTCERDEQRWKPISGAERDSGLLDEEGFFHRKAKSVSERCDPRAVNEEMRWQLDCAQRAGIDVTHFDSHMFASWHPKFLSDYIHLGHERRLPVLLLRMDDPNCGMNAEACGLDAEAVAHAGRIVHEFEEREATCAVVFDKMAGMGLRQPEERVAHAKRVLDSLPCGLTHFLIHPAQDTPELRALTPDWRARVADFEAFTSRELREHVRSSGVQVVGYKALREALRAAPPRPGAHREGVFA